MFRNPLLYFSHLMQLMQLLGMQTPRWCESWVVRPCFGNQVYASPLNFCPLMAVTALTILMSIEDKTSSLQWPGHMMSGLAECTQAVVLRRRQAGLSTTNKAALQKLGART